MKKNPNELCNPCCHRRKFLLAIKVTFLAFSTGLLSLGATTYSQSVNINLKEKNATIAEIFEKIESQSPMHSFIKMKQLI